MWVKNERTDVMQSIGRGGKEMIVNRCLYSRMPYGKMKGRQNKAKQNADKVAIIFFVVI